MPEDFAWIGDKAASKPQVHDFSAEEIVTEPQVIGEFDLAAAQGEEIAWSGTLEMAQAARIDGLACWFECELAEGIWMTNSPLAADAIDRANLFLACRQPFALGAGEGFSVSVRIKPGLSFIGWSFTPPGGTRQKLSTWEGLIGPMPSEEDRDSPLPPGHLASAQALVLELADGTRSLAQIEGRVAATFPGLFPVEAALKRFVRRMLDIGNGR